MILFSASLMVSSCKKDDPIIDKPVISNYELGYSNNKTAYPGSDLHIEADVVATGKIQSIRVWIHLEEAAKSGDSKDDTEWSVDTVYTKFSGLKNSNFHEHLDIPISATLGIYHFHFSITDMEGNVTEMEDDLNVVAPTDTQLPVITIQNAPASGAVFGNGQTINISGTITDDIAISGIYVGLVKVSQGLSDADITHANTISLLHTHDFENPANVYFSASLQVGTANDNDMPSPKPIIWESGDYYLIVKAPNAFGGGAGFSQHYLVSISM